MLKFIGDKNKTEKAYSLIDRTMNDILIVGLTNSNAGCHFETALRMHALCLSKTAI